MTAPYPPPPEETAGTLLAGRVAYRQFVTGYRTGIEPVLLAACIQARAEEAVLEAGTGAGAGLLCLAARLPLLRLAGLERDPALAGLAARNLALNSVPNAKIIIGDAEHPPFRRCFHHVMANPPWHEEAASASPDGRRDAAKRARASLPAAWVDGLTACLLPRGSMSLIISAAIVPTWMAALERAGFGAISLLPLWPRAGVPAKRAILSGILGAGSPGSILPGLVLHDGTGFTSAARAILEDGAAFG